MVSRLRSLLRDRLARRLGVPAIGTAMARLSDQGFSPELIFDVGAYHGEYAQLCRRLWPRADIACFEPQHRAAAHLQALADERTTVYNVLLGADERPSVLLHEAETASSVLVEHVDTSHPAVAHPMRSVDRVLQDDFAGRRLDLLKLDVQGYELEVLRGAEGALQGVDAVLAEVNLLDIHADVPLFADVTAWLRDRGFVAFDICGLTRRPLDRALWQADVVFVPLDSPLRRDKRWAA